MAFRRPVENRSSPSLGYRLSSDRQPGIEIANNRMPQQRMGPRPFPPERGYPMPMPMPFPRPGGFQDEREFQGFDTSETARENFISRTDGGYPDRPKSVDERFRDYLMRGLDYMPSPIGAGSRILKGLPSLYGENATEYIEELPVTPLQGDNFDDQTSGIMGAMPQERQTAGLIQTWQKIKDNISEAAANEWLASQQA